MPAETVDVKRAVAFMVLGVAGFSLMDALGKSVVSRHPVFDMLAVRSTVALIVLTAILASSGRLGTLRTRQPGGHALRAASRS